MTNCLKPPVRAVWLSHGCGGQGFWKSSKILFKVSLPPLRAAAAKVYFQYESRFGSLFSFFLPQNHSQLKGQALNALAIFGMEHLIYLPS